MPLEQPLPHTSGHKLPPPSKYPGRSTADEQRSWVHTGHIRCCGTETRCLSYPPKHATKVAYFISPQGPHMNRCQATLKLPGLDMWPSCESHGYRGHPSPASLPSRPEEIHAPETLAKSQRVRWFHRKHPLPWYCDMQQHQLSVSLWRWEEKDSAIAEWCYKYTEKRSYFKTYSLEQVLHLTCLSSRRHQLPGNNKPTSHQKQKSGCPPAPSHSWCLPFRDPAPEYLLPYVTSKKPSSHFYPLGLSSDSNPHPTRSIGAEN